LDVGRIIAGADSHFIFVKILVTADLHYALKQFDWLTAQSGDFDLIILAGDMLDIAGFLDLDTQIVVVERYFARLAENVPLIVCSGNHDGDVKNENDEYEAVWLKKAKVDGMIVDGDGLALDDFYISVCPWWDGPKSEIEVRDLLKSHAQLKKSKWIWVYHSPPFESPTAWTGRQDAGDRTLRELIEQYAPDIVFSGHIHNSPFRSGGSGNDRIGRTWVFNAGRQIGEVPAHLIVDLEAGTVDYWSLAGEECVTLG